MSAHPKVLELLFSSKFILSLKLNVLSIQKDCLRYYCVVHQNFVLFSARGIFQAWIVPFKLWSYFIGGAATKISFFDCDVCFRGMLESWSLKSSKDFDLFILPLFIFLYHAKLHLNNFTLSIQLCKLLHNDIYNLHEEITLEAFTDLKAPHNKILNSNVFWIREMLYFIIYQLFVSKLQVLILKYRICNRIHTALRKPM